MSIIIQVMKPSQAAFCASFACSAPIGIRYGLNETKLAKQLQEALQQKDDIVLVAEQEGIPVGFAWIKPRGAFSIAPYLKLIAVTDTSRSNGIGAKLLQEFEDHTFSVGKDYCLLVSDFNEQAIAFYEHHGYKQAGCLPDFAIKGVAEILMVKKRKDEKESAKNSFR
ncbi:GNAT family N-acetyltransferase [uncultured Sphaerochaeta sp.]|uniref:GNAT family N-acetyltransferase n=1 Tax=uncultured Sphaerochaeta sp. TaxID=886478 RepID=UPI002A0A46D1|nr:GNAT family N-acetyltransferase [uncultured Sphaerochaeta sp.]